jgi:hypothetical protein
MAHPFTYVLGIDCHPCDRNGPAKVGRGEWIRTTDPSVPNRSGHVDPVRSPPSNTDRSLIWTRPVERPFVASCGKALVTFVKVAGHQLRPWSDARRTLY